MVSRLSELTSKDVFTEDGSRVGSLEDVVIDPETGKVQGLLIGNVSESFLERVKLERARGVNVPYRAVKAVSDIVILRDAVYSAKSSSE